MQEIAAKNREKVIDVLCERYCFEVKGIDLYEKALEVIQASGDDNVMRMYDEMQEHCEEEREHATWLEQEIRALGGDPNAKTELVKLVEIESKGIEDIVMASSSLVHVFHGLLTAELADNAGWELLVQLADEAGDRDAKREFKKRLHQEEEHLIFVRKALLRLMQAEVLGEKVTMPKGETQLGAF
jgi:bacterioferritin (cytochrome b1)